MSNSKFPPGWDEERARRVLEHYETQSDAEAVDPADFTLACGIDAIL